jgi:DNA-binding transcriptional ArsR family regulator
MSTDVIQDMVSNETRGAPEQVSIETRAAPGEPLPHPTVKEMELAAVLHALSDPMRLKIVTGLAAGGSRTCKSFELPVTKSTCTHHFRVLRDAGVIRQRLEGTTRLSWLRREELEQRFPGLIESVLSALGEGARS